MFILILYSCGGSSKNSENKNSKEDSGILNNITETAGTVKNMSKLEEYANEMETRINSLKNLSPISKAVLKSVLPENIDGLKRISFNVGEMSALGIASGKAEYKSENTNKKLSLEIMDGAGEAASGMASILFLAFQTDKDSETESSFEKTVDLVNGRALVKETRYGEENKTSEIQWVHDKRFIVTLKGEGYSYDELSSMQKKLDLTNLK